MNVIHTMHLRRHLSAGVVDLTYILISISVVAMIVMALVYVARRVEGANYLHRQRNESTADTVIALATPKSPDW
ncbi:hypothetical protein DYB25_010349 [Aphanomyces astaci]|uniref:Uncharacterized protein n=1 Tax=Aphanomyces astaci TaxID=112090 RepID=A0A397B2U9_APHAT|nr:hypothetical protein DYB25_010349 [Aphanomyces astaci]RHY38991.1 hypothetical protein DYB38_012818 [Aphanomyces astaci]RHY48085.1 hypothetical protein DYB34_010697 [Aphanomyces astaci]RHZ40824.1 hypothetical protein DYB26_016261 [Aphanomyces astaci]